MLREVENVLAYRLSFFLHSNSRSRQIIKAWRMCKYESFRYVT